MQSKVTRQSGFTLVEIAIVLVIIGLLLGGVLKGQELITSSKIKAVANDMDAVGAAFNTYQDRYRSLPGDDAGVVGRFSAQDCGGVACAAAAAVATLGNGQMNGAWNNGMHGGGAVDNTLESRVVWQQLRASGLLKSDGLTIFDQPKHVLGGQMGVQYAAFYANNPVQNHLAVSNIQGKQAQLLDNMIDDGFMNGGALRADGTAGAGIRYVEGTAYNVVRKL